MGTRLRYMIEWGADHPCTYARSLIHVRHLVLDREIDKRNADVYRLGPNGLRLVRVFAGGQERTVNDSRGL